MSDEARARARKRAIKAEEDARDEEDAHVDNGEAPRVARVVPRPDERTEIPTIKVPSDLPSIPPPTAPSGETKELLRKIREQQRRRAEREADEAARLERRAKELVLKSRNETKLRRRMERHAERMRELAPELGYDPERAITPLPTMDSPDIVLVEQSTMQEGRSYVRLVYNSKQNQYAYHAIEPPLEDNERQVLDFLRDTLVRTLEARPQDTDPADWEAMLVDAVDRAVVDHSILIDDVSKQRILYYILRDFLGYGAIDVLMRDPMIEDISCDGPGIPVYIFHRQYESVRTNIIFSKDLELDSYVIRLGQRCGKHISIADPLLDATLPDGSRLQASLSKEVTTRGSTFTVRRFRADPLTPPDLVRIGTLDSRMAAYFWLAMSEAKSILFGGGTASGKTTTLNAASLFIPPSRKIVSIEDTRELNLPHENWIAGLTRGGFTGEYVGGKQAGAIDMYKLLESALRQRPEYLIVGEVRGPEAATLFQAMATGHATYSTLHADSVPSAVYRLENPPINVPRIMLQTLDVVVIQIQVRIGQKPARRVKEVVEVLGQDPDSGDLITNTLFTWNPATDKYDYSGTSQKMQEIAERSNLTPEQVQAEWDQRREVIDWMVAKGIRRIDDVGSVVAEYYRRPGELVARVQDAMKLTSAAKKGGGGGRGG